MGATPKEDIDKQHQEALNIVNSGSMPCAERVNRGEIPLRWKVTPTAEDPYFIKLEEERMQDVQERIVPELLPCDCEENRNFDEMELVSSSTDNGYRNPESCISSRGQVDVSSILKLIEEGCQDVAPISQSTSEKLKKQKVLSPTNLWDEVNAAINNVHVIRPSHDAWGIKKIVLMFCDDFLQTVYEMPWWHKKLEMKRAIQPILDKLNVEPNRLVRMLFASLPPGVTIPVHHDTGAWVKYTHRVHVPVVVQDPNRILFRCGPTASTMQRVDCTPGHIFEMNNQAKHAVSNCHDSHHRVHLILDYVDVSFRIRQRIKLQPGETLLQTRRSIDRASDKGKRPTPSFMIIGAQKSGTTSIYEYLNQHPLVVRAKRRETHCLDWRWRTDLNTKLERRKHCLGFFHAKELALHPSCLSGDSTPSYLLDSFRCIPRLKEVFTHDIKFIAILRDPIRRAKSHYEMVTSLDGTPEQIQNRGKEWLDLTLEQVIELDFQHMNNCGLIPYWNLETKTIDSSVFLAFVGSKEEDEAFTKYLQTYVPMGSGSHSIITRGMYELQLRQWFRAFNPDLFLVLKLEDMKHDGVHKTMKKVWAHLGLPEYEIHDETARNSRSYDDMNAETRAMLQKFYEPHNKRLEFLLGKEWEKPW
jgi:hypothetical protein